MTEDEIRNRLDRIDAAFEGRSRIKPEDIAPMVTEDDQGISVVHDFSGGKTKEQLATDAASIINEIMGLKDRTRAWLSGKGEDPEEVDQFLKSSPSPALVHDLANLDKHGRHSRTTVSGKKPNLVEVRRAMTLKYDPATGKYEKSGQFTGHAIDLVKGEVSGKAQSAGVEVVLVSDINDQKSGLKIGELQKLLPDAVYAWEQFLKAQGLPL